MTEPLKHRTCGKTHFNCTCGDYVMPKGKFQGKRISTIWYADNGERYLKWYAENVTDETAAFIDSFLTQKGVR